MPSCAACQTRFTKEQRAYKCTLCDERRVAELAYYCDRACQKRHWPEHKAFHARLEIEEQKIVANASKYTINSPVDDLRQLLRDVRGLLVTLKEGSPGHEQYSTHAAGIEAELRKRIAADLAALKLADD